MGHLQVKQSLDGAHACDELEPNLFYWIRKFDLENFG